METYPTKEGTHTSKPTRTKHKAKNKKRNFFPFIVLFLLLSIIILIFSIYSYQKSLATTSHIEVFFTEEFNDVNEMWTTYDANYLADYHGQSGVIKLARNEYFSPNMMTTEGLNSIQSDTFVYHFKTRLHSFTQSSVTLSTLYFPTGPITIVVNKDHQLGIATEFKAEPIYSSSDEIMKDTWEDIYVYVDGLGNEVSLYLNNNKLMTIPYKGETYPLQELWFGSIWVGGAGGYGIPTDIAFDEIQIGNKALLPQPSYTDYIFSTFTK